MTTKELPLRCPTCGSVLHEISADTGYHACRRGHTWAVSITDSFKYKLIEQ